MTHSYLISAVKYRPKFALNTLGSLRIILHITRWVLFTVLFTRVYVVKPIGHVTHCLLCPRRSYGKMFSGEMPIKTLLLHRADGWVDLTRTGVSGETPTDPSMSFSLTNLPQGFSSPYRSRSLPVWNKWSIGASVIPLTHAQETSTCTRSLRYWQNFDAPVLYKLARNSMGFHYLIQIKIDWLIELCSITARNLTTRKKTRAGKHVRRASFLCK